MQDDSQRRLTISLPDWAREERLVKKLRAVAKQQRRSLSFMVIEAIREYLENHKDES